jgi:hypothetical protein
VTQVVLPAATVRLVVPAVARLAAVPLGERVACLDAAQVALPAVALVVVEALAKAVVSPGSSRAAAHLRSCSPLPHV